MSLLQTCGRASDCSDEDIVELSDLEMSFVDKENNLETQLRCENLYSWQMMKETPMFSSWTECIEISRGVFAAGWLRHMVYQL